jgi:ribosomal protein S18 acetylase RimI-like enzyme
LIAIRRARPEDANSVANGEYAAARTPGLLNARPGEVPEQAFLDKITALANKANGLYVVAEDGADIVGHLLLDPLPLAANAHVCTLTVVVYPGWQGRGIGRQLLSHAIAWASAAATVDKIELRVRASNERAVHLYRSLGFEDEGRLRRRVKDDRGICHDDIAMGLFV